MRRFTMLAACLGLGLVFALPPEPAGARERRETAAQRGAAGPQAKPQRGHASFYAERFHGKRMANGKRFHRNSASAASRTLPLGTRARVRNLENGRTAVVTIEDRGPFKRGRVLDVSPRVATQLGMREQGTAMVEIVPLGGRQDPG